MYIYNNKALRYIYILLYDNVYKIINLYSSFLNVNNCSFMC